MKQESKSAWDSRKRVGLRSSRSTSLKAVLIAEAKDKRWRELTVDRIVPSPTEDNVLEHQQSMYSLVYSHIN